MTDKMLELVKLGREAVFGWRKLGLLIAILAASFIWLFEYTMKTEAAVIVPDLPVTFAAMVAGLYGMFVLGNWAGKREAAKGSGEPS